MTTDPDWLLINRENWDSRVPVHAASDFYDLPGFGEGAVSTLRPYELDEVGDVSGKRLLHLQCHMGQDTLSWARRGADVTGLDFSAPAIRRADELSLSTGLKDRARFVVADVYNAPTALEGQRFDVVYTGIGALVWLPDLVRWARVVSSLLSDGGFLYLAEFHPAGDLLGQDGTTVEYDYFQPEGQTYDNPHTYTDGPELGNSTSVQWQHPLGDVVSALAAAGLRIEFLHERDVTLFRRYRALERVPGGYGFPAGRPRVPLMYSVRARKTV
ncbi:methyltransferase type 12 [Streptomyces sp. 150FB]|uniref:class I SAM-dependent methyltransferase n=1 Tax=Streptomyces sp. 150FB TaxID=1576605 RepID=UPI000589356E|nr:class I SAM-dependent methyltransferase [Streptomyces sp. 150FB]KIF75368.1 methyltransferase type 12 [Streptomyces sp. 150FB]